MNKNELPFIVTTDEESANILISCGFQILEHTCDHYLFINCRDFSYADTNLDTGKITYTKMLCF